MVQCSVANQKREAQLQGILSQDAQYICDRIGIGQIFLMLIISTIFKKLLLSILLLKKLAQNVYVQSLCFTYIFKWKGTSSSYS